MHTQYFCQCGYSELCIWWYTTVLCSIFQALILSPGRTGGENSSWTLIVKHSFSVLFSVGRRNIITNSLASWPRWSNTRSQSCSQSGGEISQTHSLLDRGGRVILALSPGWTGGEIIVMNYSSCSFLDRGGRVLLALSPGWTGGEK